MFLNGEDLDCFLCFESVFLLKNVGVLTVTFSCCSTLLVPMPFHFFVSCDASQNSRSLVKNAGNPKKAKKKKN